MQRNIFGIVGIGLLTSYNVQYGSDALRVLNARMPRFTRVY